MSERRDLIDRARFKAVYEEAKARQSASPVVTRNVVRCSVRLVENQLKEGRLGNHTVYADEPAERGGTDRGPAPLQYFIAGVGF